MPGKIWRQAFIIATPVWLVAVILLWSKIPKYELIIDSKSGISSNSLPVHHVDLDNDSITEHITYRNNHNGFASYGIYLSNNETVDQYNFGGSVIKRGNINFGDYDGNGFKEIYLPIERNDSIFLTALQYPEKEPFLAERFICRHNPVNNKNDIGITVVGLTDLDGDRYKEVIINLTAGFSLQPRALYAYSIKKDSLWRSPLSGAAIGRVSFADLDGDGINEVLAGSGAVANYDDLNFPYHDHSAWVMVFNPDLTFKFPPLEYPGAPRYTNVRQVNFDNEQYLLVGYTWRGMVNSDSALTLLTTTGEVIRRSHTLTDGQKNLLLKDNKPFLFDLQNHELFTLNKNLEMAKIFDFGEGKATLHPVDIDQDGQAEWVYSNLDNNTITIYRSDLTNPAMLQHHGSINYLPSQGIRKMADFHGFEARINEGSLLLEYRKNPDYIYKWPAAILVYLILFTLIYYILNYRELKVVARNKQLLELQLSSFKSQFDSHFTFNALNAIGSIIYKGKKEEAYDYFTKFASMVRTSLDNTREPIVKLQDELDFVRNYFELQKLRYKEKLVYDIQVDEQVDLQVNIPKMLIQVHVENAIKHGTSPKKKGGKVSIILHRDGNDLLIGIKDDGIGREAAGQRNTDSPGKGLIMMHEFYALFNKLYGIKIEEKIRDLYDRKKQPAGTQITIKLPNIYV